MSSALRVFQGRTDTRTCSREDAGQPSPLLGGGVGATS